MKKLWVNCKKPVTIFHLITTLDRGGAENFLLTLCEGLQKRDCRIEIGYLQGKGELTSEYQRLKIPVHFFSIRGFSPFFSFFRLVRYLQRRHFDIVHTHLFKADVFGTLATKLAGIPLLICTKHNEDQYLRLWGIGWIARRLAGWNSTVIAISEAVKRFLIHNACFPEKKIQVIYYGIPMEVEQSSHRQLSSRAVEQSGSPEVQKSGSQEKGTRTQEHQTPVPSSKFQVPNSDVQVIIGTLSRLEYQKGLDILIRAFALVQERIKLDPFLSTLDVRLWIAGRGSQKEFLQQLTHDLGLDGKVHFLGFQKNIQYFFNQIDIFVLSSRWEGFGLVLLEAMRSGKPIVATRVGAIPEIIEHGKTGLLVPPEDPPALAHALQRIIDNPEWAQTLAQRSQETLRQRFSFPVVLNSHKNLYDSLLEPTK